MRELHSLLIAIIAGVGCADLLGADFDRNSATSDGKDATADGMSSPTPLAIEDASVGDGPVTIGEASIPEDSGIAPRDASSADATCATCVLKPSNVATFGALPTVSRTVSLPPVTSFDTSLECTGGAMIGDCTVVSQSVGPEACVCRAAVVNVENLSVTGKRALVLLVRDTVTIAGTLDVAGEVYVGGPGSEPYMASPLTGEFDYGTEDLIPLRGGEDASPKNTSAGGGGGGALQISAGVSITITSAGRIQAGGGGGAGGFYGGYPAGSGGGVLIEAPLLTIAGEILANGGGGGGGGDGDRAGDEGVDARHAGRNAASGGQSREGRGCPQYGYTSGGDGGNGATRSSPAGPGQKGDSVGCIPAEYLGAGGKGGGVGRVRLNTGPGGGSLVVSPSAHVSPQASWGVIAY